MHAARVIPWSDLAAALTGVDVVAEMERAFVEYSDGLCVVPPIGELVFEQPPGDVHIKYGYVRGDEHYVIKIASGFYDNPSLGLPSGNGLMLLFRQQTGELVAVLLDECRLTDIRTAAAGAVAAKHLAPSRVERIGIVGTGVQARLQLEYLREVVDCDEVLVWGRSPDRVAAYCRESGAKGFRVTPADTLDELAAACRLIVTTTPSTEPLVSTSAIQPGTHITAMGSDTETKQELEAELVARADVLVADSIEQCRSRGEISQALRAGILDPDRAVELGAVVSGRAAGRTSDEQITVVDLTGVAVQDVRIADSVYRRLVAP